MNKEELLEYQRRWQAVEEFIRVERQQAPIELRWRQLNSLVGLGMIFPKHKEYREREVATIRERWNQLRTAYSDC
jgi:hypothetical protein